MKNNAVYLMTPPQREAVIELARAYAEYLSTVTNYRQYLVDSSKRLLAAQDALGIELIPRTALLLHQEAA